MFAEALVLAAAFEILPFYQQKPDYAAFRPFWSREGETSDVLWPVFTAHRDWRRFLSLFPIRWVDGVDRNWAKFWTFYERDENPVETRHSLFWGIIRWRTHCG